MDDCAATVYTKCCHSVSPQVRALVRSRNEAAVEGIPRSVEVITGDLGDYASCRAAMEGADKVICCASARSNITADLVRVEEQGIANLSKAFQVSHGMGCTAGLQDVPGSSPSGLTLAPSSSRLTNILQLVSQSNVLAVSLVFYPHHRFELQIMLSAHARGV